MTIRPVGRIIDLSVSRSAIDMGRPVDEALGLVRAVPGRVDAGLTAAGVGLRGVLDQPPLRRSPRTGRRRLVVLLAVSGLIAVAAASWWRRRAAAMAAEAERRLDAEALERAAGEGMILDPGPWGRSTTPASAEDDSTSVGQDRTDPSADEVRQAAVGVGIAPA